MNNFSERINKVFSSKVNFASLEEAIKAKYSDPSKIKSLRFPSTGNNGSLRGSVKAAVVIADDGNHDESVDVYMCDQSSKVIRKIVIPDDIYEGSDDELDKWAVDKANWYWTERGGLD